MSGFSFNLFTDFHDWIDPRHTGKLLSAAAVAWCRGHIQLTIITIETMGNCMSRDHKTKEEWYSGIKI